MVSAFAENMDEEGMLSDVSSIDDDEYEQIVRGWQWEEAEVDEVLTSLGLPVATLVR